MIPADARMWCDNGTEMTIVEISKSPTLIANAIRREKLTEWLDKHTTGEYQITPWLIGFEHATEATFFQLAYR